MKRIVDTINKLSGKYHPHNIFQDWVEMTAISISNQCIYNQSLEDKYISIANKYTESELAQLVYLANILVELFEKNIDDYLGKIYMMLNAGSAKTGQFFTPFHLCEMMGKIALVGYKGDVIKVNEPSVGGGGNILGYAKALEELGYEYREKLNVIAQDLDFKCVYMAYVQFSLCGINAVVIQGNTLLGEENYKLYTPMYVLRGGFNER